jgi:hypothetical protein
MGTFVTKNTIQTTHGRLPRREGNCPDLAGGLRIPSIRNVDDLHAWLEDAYIAYTLHQSLELRLQIGEAITAAALDAWQEES